MHHISTADLLHMWQHSFEDLKIFLSGHTNLFNYILNKTAEIALICIAAGFVYNVIQILHASNIIHMVYNNALQALNESHHYSYALQYLL